MRKISLQIIVAAVTSSTSRMATVVGVKGRIVPTAARTRVHRGEEEVATGSEKL
jgi:hypothetical protein